MEATSIEEDMMLVMVLLQQFTRNPRALIRNPPYKKLRLHPDVELNCTCRRHTSYQYLLVRFPNHLMKFSRRIRECFADTHSSQSHSRGNNGSSL
jgi:hypothetical protein